ncbi:putative P-loop containing nucleoside triphosphate hydrolase [Helianthus annuus]|nr:putative P-loop containing nucleoside triphosphate hydrolase [Helianthus annuus]KAJ0803520.1 putative P-loop containing nucleoside triphosphate hydrolase [Helianthus annuus]KAJ0941492.1 putative P-loop containing nucleoside triphosphate hydrolase [Helianthus annuus]
MRIQELISKYSDITWTDAPLPTGRDTSSTISTPLSSSPGGDDFKSRDVPFNDALKLLQQDDNKSQVIALCGMGGVGKTTMMEQLKKVAEDKKMFDFFVKVTLGSVGEIRDQTMHNRSDIWDNFLGFTSQIENTSTRE